MSRFDLFVKKFAMSRDMSLGDLYRDLHELTGISAPSLVHWRKGRRTPQLKKLTALAEYFDLTRDEVLELIADNNNGEMKNGNFENN